MMVIAVIQILEKFHIYHHITIVSLLTLLIILYKRLNTNNENLLPSPRRLPIVGNLHQLGTLPHRSLRSLSMKYGDLMYLHLGSKPTLVVSSPNEAEEIMKTNDTIFANRPVPKVARILLYNGMDLAFSKYGEYWRKIKSICLMNMLSNKKVRSFRKIREEEVGLMIENIKKSTPYTPIDLSANFTKLSNNVVGQVVFGKKDVCDNIRVLLNDLSEALGAFCIGEFVPWLSWTDHLSGTIRKATKTAKVFDVIIEKNVHEHVHAHNQKDNEDREHVHAHAHHQKDHEDLVDVLLEIRRNDPSFQMETLKALLLNMLVGGIETNVTLLEWTMSELLRHPRVMRNLQDEVRQFLKDKPIIDEDGLNEMSYLKAVIKEALRLHPPLPFLLLREPSQDTKVQNYDIATGTQVLINAWAIQRHPAYWDEPEEFRPERFLDNVDNVNENGLRFIPFGAGRRSCPGLSFANVIIELVLANIIGKFNWKCDQVDENSFMAEQFGTSMRRRDHLFGIPTPYLSN